MTDTERIRAIIKKRTETNDEWQAGVEKCWSELTDALTEDIEVTRKFLLEDCTADEASWVSEVYDDIIYKTQSREYIDILRKSIERFPEEAEEYHMSSNLDLAVKVHALELARVAPQPRAPPGTRGLVSPGRQMPHSPIEQVVQVSHRAWTKPRRVRLFQ